MKGVKEIEGRLGGSRQYLVAREGADLGRAGVGDGNDLDELGIFESLRLGGGESGLEVDAPIGAQPHETLQRNDRGTPDEGPFRRRDMLLVQFGGIVVAGEDRPDYSKGPDVSMEVQGQRRQQLGAPDLGVVDERRGSHRGLTRRGNATAATVGEN